MDETIIASIAATVAGLAGVVVSKWLPQKGSTEDALIGRRAARLEDVVDILSSASDELAAQIDASRARLVDALDAVERAEAAGLPLVVLARPDAVLARQSRRRMKAGKG